MLLSVSHRISSKGSFQSFPHHRFLLFQLHRWRCVLPSAGGAAASSMFMLCCVRCCSFRLYFASIAFTVFFPFVSSSGKIPIGIRRSQGYHKGHVSLRTILPISFHAKSRRQCLRPVLGNKKARQQPRVSCLMGGKELSGNGNSVVSRLRGVPLKHTTPPLSIVWHKYTGSIQSLSTERSF